MTESLCECGHFDSEHYAGECLHFINPASVICACRGFITPAERREQTMPSAEVPDFRTPGDDFGA